MISQIMIISLSLFNFYAMAETSPVSLLPDKSNPVEGILTTEILQGLRDPFQIPTLIGRKKEKPKQDLQLVQLKDIKLNGVITGPKKTRALLSIPNGKTFFISVGDKVGLRDGHVSKIRPEAVTIVEYDLDENGKKVIEEFEVQLNGEVVSLSDQKGAYQ